jgi:putative SOS response-associated peptidase YedK
MCGRYTETKGLIDLQQRFAFAEPADEVRAQLVPRYNVAPTQMCPVVIQNTEGARELVLMKWGLIPHWAKDEKVPYSTFNAKSETVDQAASFKRAFAEPSFEKGRGRCLVLADSFIEWLKDTKPKQPVRFHLPDFAPFAFAGLYDRWKRHDGSYLYTFTILTTTPSGDVAHVHNRMPVILRQQDEGRWLDPATPAVEIAPLLRPYDDGSLHEMRINPLVNSSRIDAPECLEPWE